METSNGALLFPELRDTTPTLLAGLFTNCPTCQRLWPVGLATTRRSCTGDFSNYLVSQRIGSAVELIPHLFSPNNLRPTGQRGMYAYARYGADSINDAAFRVLTA